MNDVDQQVERKSEENWRLRHRKRGMMIKRHKNMKFGDDEGRRVRRRSYHFREMISGVGSLLNAGVRSVRIDCMFLC
jgi:hypothetical protein